MLTTKSSDMSDRSADVLSTIEVAHMLGLAVRSVQLMVDRGEMQAWRTSGGHRRISKASVEQWLASRQGNRVEELAIQSPPGLGTAQRPGYKILLIEDSTHFQNLVALLLQEHVPDAQLYMASDGISGLAKFGQIQPDCLLVDILLPGIDGATLITALKSNPLFANCQLIIVTGLNHEQLEPYAFALQGLPIIHKTRIAIDLIPLLSAVTSAQTKSAQSSPVQSAA